MALQIFFDGYKQLPILIDFENAFMNAVSKVIAFSAINDYYFDHLPKCQSKIGDSGFEFFYENSPTVYCCRVFIHLRTIYRCPE